MGVILGRGLGWRLGIFASTLLLVAATARISSAADDPAKQFVDAYVKAWNSGDVESLGRMWTEDGELVDSDGVAIDRKALLAKRMASGNGPHPMLSIRLDKVRQLDPDVVLVDGESKMSTPQGAVIQQTQFSGVLLRKDGAWRIRLIRHESSRRPGQEPPEDPLKELGWLVGEWIGMGEGIRVHTASSWDLGNRYIVSRTEFEPATGQPYDVEARIGWDPESHSVKSWYFDSRGVTSTTLWQKNSDHWLGTITGTQSDGERFSGTMAITPIDKDSYLRTLTNMKVGEQTIPDQELRMFRVPEQPAE